MHLSVYGVLLFTIVMWFFCPLLTKLKKACECKRFTTIGLGQGQVQGRVSSSVYFVIFF